MWPQEDWEVTKEQARNTEIQRLDYQPNAPCRLDLEIIPVSDLKRRRRNKQSVNTHRYRFHSLVYVTDGQCTQWVDFKAIGCEPGSLLVVRPGQAHSFGEDENWDGWIILFRPEFLLPALTPTRDVRLVFDVERLPRHLNLRSEDQRCLVNSISQMREDAQIAAPSEDVHALLRYQLHTFLIRINILRGQEQGEKMLNSPELNRFKRFEQLVDQQFAQSHQVAEYARQLGYTEKSLTRATLSVMDMTAKSFITTRINLEAKRLLAHTDLPINAIAGKLGFEEATNFVKFFKREVHCTPTEFRRRHAIDGPRS
ncbi:AraC family transcriptional regulator [Paraburkholderia caribensis]|nr:AraC family transcriptional regulator [Paraburkholderia caribensis]